MSSKTKSVNLRRLLSIPILSVFVLAGFIYYITIFIFLEDWLGLHSSSGSLNTLIFSVLSCFTLFSFLVCATTDPGRVPSEYVPDIEHSDASDQESKKNDVQLRRCDKCSAFKPPRAHHCRVCKRCVLRMDHHCLWINNCVGHRNYKAYVILVFFSTVTNIHSSVIIVCSAILKDWAFNGTISLKIFYICSAIMTMGFSFTLGTLLGWHLHLITRNKTTIEYYESVRAEWLARKSGQSYHHPFDVGFYKNITLILGPNMLKWLFPTAVSHLKDGIQFPTARDSL